MDLISTVFEYSKSAFFNIPIQIHLSVVVAFIFLIFRRVFAAPFIYPLKKRLGESAGEYSENVKKTGDNMGYFIFSLVLMGLVNYNRFDAGYYNTVFLIAQTISVVFAFLTILSLIFFVEFLLIRRLGAADIVRAWIVKLGSAFIFSTMIITILELWGIPVFTLLAGLGIFGVAIAFSAQDLFKNILAGIVIVIEKRFNIGEVVTVEGSVMGVVEKTGFRSTLIRDFDQCPHYVPNVLFIDSIMTNNSKRSYRRINMKIGVLYSTGIEQLKQICLDIENYIKESDEFNTDMGIHAYIYEFDSSSINILIIAYTEFDWKKYLQSRENLNEQIIKIVKANKSDFAFPSRTLYIDDNSVIGDGEAVHNLVKSDKI